MAKHRQDACVTKSEGNSNGRSYIKTRAHCGRRKESAPEKSKAKGRASATVVRLRLTPVHEYS